MATVATAGVFLIVHCCTAMQSDPELLPRTEGELQQLAQEVDKLMLATQSEVCNGQ